MSNLTADVVNAWARWNTFRESDRRIEALFAGLHPVASAIGYKVRDQLGVFQRLAYEVELGDQVHIATVNEVRIIATIHRPVPLLGTLHDIKILQRRPGRDDDLGLEHLDVRVDPGVDLIELAARLKACGTLGVAYEVESNDDHQWLSILYGGLEIKIVDHDVWSVCVQEAQAALIVT